VARPVLLAAAIALVTAGAIALGIALLAAEQLFALLPPLTIDIDALRGAIVALGAGLTALGVVHVLVLVGLRAGRRVAWTAGTLLAAGMASTCVALAAASATSAVADPGRWIAFAGGALAAAIGAVAYGVAAWQLVAESRHRSAI
jgi:hypothetical protein